MNSHTAAREAAHRRATVDAMFERCLLCHRDGCVPAHWPRHRGMGAGHAGWDPEEWVPLCRECHDLVDGRLGRQAARRRARERLAVRAEEWQRRVRRRTAVQ